MHVEYYCTYCYVPVFAVRFRNVICLFIIRLQLSAMHYNENANRQQAVTSTGSLRYSVVYPKYKQGDYTVRPLKADPTYGN